MKALLKQTKNNKIIRASVLKLHSGSESLNKSLPEENGFHLLAEGHKDSLASFRRDFQSLRGATEEAFSYVLTKHTCESGGTERKASPADLNVQEGSQKEIWSEIAWIQATVNLLL